jgi:AcrR family transcriptional regulator
VTARRVDATRNRERILQAARSAFSDPGADVSMAEVARRAGVGSATLYRNFRDRRELLTALYVDEIDQLCAAADLDAGPPGPALLAWLRRFSAYFAGKGVVAAELLQHRAGDDPVFTGGYTRIVAAGRPLLLAAQEAGAVRTDLTLEQVLDLVAAVTRIPGDAAYREPILAAALDALRPPAG